MKKNTQQAEPEFTVDADGQQLAHISLANTHHRATLYAEDYRRLVAAGFSTRWSYRNNGSGFVYPTLNAYTAEGHGREVTIARLITNAPRGQRVRAIDGNPLNLRTENLEFFPGPVWLSASDWFPTAASLRKAGIDLVQDGRAHSRPRKSAERTHKPADVTGKPTPPHSDRPSTERPSVDRAALSARVRALVSAGQQLAP